MKILSALVAAAALAACAPATAPPAAPSPEGAVALPGTPLPNDIRWVRSAAEHDAIFLQTYRAATAEVREEAARRRPGTWAVILDADETVLDNSEYQRRLARSGGTFSSDTWNAWVREEEAAALPGATEFIATVQDLGGRVAIVTNRDASVCPETRANLVALGIRPDAVLCQTGPSDKNPRFELVRSGATPEGLPPLEVIVWVGDNIQDFPELTQAAAAAPGALAPFGERYFLLPNPMYGSWERLPPEGG